MPKLSASLSEWEVQALEKHFGPEWGDLSIERTKVVLEVKLLLRQLEGKANAP